MAWGMWRYGGNRPSDERSQSACYPFLRPLFPPHGGGGYLRPAGDGEQAMRGSGDECVDLMFFTRVLDFLYRLWIARSPDVVSSLRLVRASRRASRSFYPVASRCLFVLFSSRLVPRLVITSRPSSRLACSSRSSYLRFPGGVSSYPRVSVPPSHHIVLPGRLACPSRFFLFIRLIVLRVWDEMFLRGRRVPISSR